VDDDVDDDEDVSLLDVTWAAAAGRNAATARDIRHALASDIVDIKIILSFLTLRCRYFSSTVVEAKNN
jgi:hypothetical protein